LEANGSRRGKAGLIAMVPCSAKIPQIQSKLGNFAQGRCLHDKQPLPTQLPDRPAGPPRTVRKNPVSLAGDVNNVANVTGSGRSQFHDRAFTADQAKSQIEARGYSAIAQLKKDDRGNWRGEAVKGGHSVDVAVNFNGSIESKKPGRDSHPHHEGPSLG
jgi:hypothetical protein